LSVLDQLHGLEQQVAKRLSELEPLVAEYEELKKVAERLGVKPARRQTRKRSPRRPANGGSRGAERRAAVMAVVKRRPGITVAELGSELGVDPTGLYRVIARLEEQGQLRKNGRALEPLA
jgi:MarR family